MITNICVDFLVTNIMNMHLFVLHIGHMCTFAYYVSHHTTIKENIAKITVTTRNTHGRARHFQYHSEKEWITYTSLKYKISWFFQQILIYIYIYSQTCIKRSAIAVCSFPECGTEELWLCLYWSKYDPTLQI
jgi:hypothetical protein